MLVEHVLLDEHLCKLFSILNQRFSEYSQSVSIILWESVRITDSEPHPRPKTAETSRMEPGSLI